MTLRQDLLRAWRNSLRAFGTKRFIREGIRARVIEWLNPWQKETAERFVVPFFGFEYEGHFNDAQDYSVFFRGGYENPELNVLAAIARQVEDCVAFDVGTHTGQHMLLLSRFCAKVYGFEPMPESRSTALRRLDRNEITNVELLGFGLGTEDSEIPFYWDASNLNHMAGSFVADHAHLAEFGKLQVRHGDRWAREAGVTRVDVIKIDVEGFEADVLLGLKELLSSEPYILVEISWTAFDRIEAQGGLGEILPFAFDLFRVRSGRTALFFDLDGFQLIPIGRIERPGAWGYNVLIVPRSRPLQSTVSRRIRSQ